MLDRPALYHYANLVTAHRAQKALFCSFGAIERESQSAQNILKGENMTVEQTDYLFVIPALLLGLLFFYGAYAQPAKDRAVRITVFAIGLLFFTLGTIYTPSLLAQYYLIP